MRRWLVVLGMVLWASGCPKPDPTPTPPECTAGNKDCQCNTDGTCGAGLRCTSGKCADCPAGEQGCACGTGDSCGTGLACMGSVCVTETCVNGTAGCPCNTGNTCSGELQCRQNVCTACNADAVGCACGTGNTCMTGLVCDATTSDCRLPRECTAAGCSPHQVCQAATGSADAVCLSQCDSGYRWDATSETCVAIASCSAGMEGNITQQCADQNRPCVPGTGGADATCGDCLTGFAEENGSCRAVLTCMTVNTSCAAQNKECVAETANGDATCGNCLAGFQMVTMGVCTLIPTVTCDPGSDLLTTCNAQNRECQTVDGGAMCGACATGFVDIGGTCLSQQSCEDLGCTALGRTCMNVVLDGGPPVATGCGVCLQGLVPSSATPGSQCRLPLTCADVASTCSATQYCKDGMGLMDATCEARPCPANQAYTNFNNMGCISCGTGCNAPGETGRFWPFTVNNTTDCVCETAPNYYFETGNNASAKPCDADGDGFIRESARDYMTSTDPALRTNARCNVHRIDRITLRNEFMQEREIVLCEGGDVLAGATCAMPKPVDLYESVRNDDDTQLSQDVTLRSYGTGTGRRLRANEVNPFTRACVSPNADWNDNDQPDLSEWHGMPAATDVFSRYSYFIELHTGAYEPPATGGAFGTYVIEEKSRCSPDFKLAYNTQRTMDGGVISDGDYWRQCTRRQDTGYNDQLNPADPNVGMDFAEWSCANMADNCSTPDPVPMPPSGSSIPPHGLCQVQDQLPPASGGWRGMHHHSQFKCVQLISDTAVPATPELAAASVRRADLYDNVADARRLQFNRCNIACPAGDTSCTADCSTGTCQVSSIEPGTAPNPSDPLLTCAPIAAMSVNTDEVGFVAVRFVKDLPYANGCINENDEAAFHNLCPGAVDNPTPGVVIGEGDPSNFGSLICGCGLNYGGPTCDQGCPTANLFHEQTYNASTRQGYWMCAQPTTITGTVAFDGGPMGNSYTLRATTPVAVTPTTVLCEGNCDGGYRLR